MENKTAKQNKHTSFGDIWDKAYLNWHKSTGSETLKTCVVREFELHASLQCAEMKEENERLKASNERFVKAISELAYLIERIKNG